MRARAAAVALALAWLSPRTSGGPLITGSANNPVSHLQGCYDIGNRSVCANKRRCATDPVMRRTCALTCRTCTNLVVPVHIGVLMDGMLPIPPETTSVLLEIGSSDRNTLDEELLPRQHGSFLVTAEPLLDKYARALTRWRRANAVRDSLEPLGQHHARGIILPLAIAPVPVPARSEAYAGGGGAGHTPSTPARAYGPRAHGHDGRGVASAETSGLGATRTLNVGGNAGCTSLLAANRTRGRGGGNKVFGGWCDTVGVNTRTVWTVPLAQLLTWVGRDVDFLKVDAQGMDLAIVRSGGSMLRRLRRVQLEVVSDDCRPVYEAQPTCSAVVEEMARLGFVPLAPVPCAPSMPREVDGGQPRTRTAR